MVVHVQWFDTDNLFLPVCLSVHIFGSMYRSAVFHIMALVLYFRLFQQIPCQCSISSHAAMANIWAWRKNICLRHETLPRLDVQQIRSRIFYRHPQLWIPVLWFTYDVNSSFRRPCSAYTCSASHLHCNPLTHWGWDNMAAISQTTFSNWFSEYKYLHFD